MIQNIINIINTKKKKNKLNLIYDYTCDYLDTEFAEKNICNFQKDMCEYNRQRQKNLRVCSCCTKVRTKEVCKYFNKKEKRCSIKCISCKLFVCHYLRTKKNIRYPMNKIPYLHYFLSLRQKIICKFSYFMPKEEIMDSLLKFYKWS